MDETPEQRQRRLEVRAQAQRNLQAARDSGDPVALTRAQSDLTRLAQARRGTAFLQRQAEDPDFVGRQQRTFDADFRRSQQAQADDLRARIEAGEVSPDALDAVSGRVTELEGGALGGFQFQRTPEERLALAQRQARGAGDFLSGFELDDIDALVRGEGGGPLIEPTDTRSRIQAQIAQRDAASQFAESSAFDRQRFDEETRRQLSRLPVNESEARVGAIEAEIQRGLADQRFREEQFALERRRVEAQIAEQERAARVAAQQQNRVEAQQRVDPFIDAAGLAVSRYLEGKGSLVALDNAIEVISQLPPEIRQEATKLLMAKISLDSPDALAGGRSLAPNIFEIGSAFAAPGVGLANFNRRQAAERVRHAEISDRLTKLANGLE